MDGFISTFVNKIDRKGRVSIPADFRAVLARRNSAKVLLFPALHVNAIEGAGEDYLAAIERDIEALPAFSQAQDDMRDAILPKIHWLAFDSEGRVVLPESLIAHAKLSDTAVFIGRGANFHIWNPAAVEARMSEARARLQAQRRNGGGA
ncbi:MAG TPA: hypothetical protein VEU47_04590 [Candidatus Cybelea sp.]|nr:hypothetical protein [Candidatus Cybelea sp.]